MGYYSTEMARLAALSAALNKENIERLSQHLFSVAECKSETFAPVRDVPAAPEDYDNLTEAEKDTHRAYVRNLFTISIMTP